jgi:glycerol kinase
LKKYILAIDQGTTGSRAVLYDKNAAQIALAYKEFQQYFPKPGWVEHDPIDIWESVRYTIQKVLKKVQSVEIVAIGITNQRETVVVWDKETGKPIYNAIVWQCRRTAARCNQLKKDKAFAQFLRKRTGLPLDAYFSATKIEWILSNVPGARKKADEGKLLCGTTDTWVLWNLTGGFAHATDYTNASRTLLFNIDTLKWDDAILRKFNIPKKILPEVKKSSGFFGVTQKIGALKAGIPITGIAGDQQAALFGQGCFNPGSMKNTYGTGAFVLLNTGKKKVLSRHGLITTIGCGAHGEPVYVLEGSIFIAGAGIQWLRDKLHLISHAHESEHLASCVPDTGQVYFVPALVGLGAPYWDQDARGAFIGLTRGTSKEHIVRAVTEAMCYQTKDVLIAMEKDSGLRVRKLKIDGGAVVNNFLCQFQADILGFDVIRPKVIEITSLGAAYLAGLAVTYWKNSREIEQYWNIDTKFSSSMSSKKRAILYAGWKDALSRVTSCTV